MFENIRNVITSIPMDRLRPNLCGHIPSCPDMSPRFGCHGNGLCLATAHWTLCSYGRLKAHNFLIKFGTEQQVRIITTVTWLNIKIFKFRKYIRNAITRLPIDRLGRNLGGHMRLPWQGPLPSNGALYIQQLWASGGWTREPISMEIGVQQQIRTRMTDTWSNIIFF